MPQALDTGTDEVELSRCHTPLGTERERIGLRISYFVVENRLVSFLNSRRERSISPIAELAQLRPDRSLMGPRTEFLSTTSVFLFLVVESNHNSAVPDVFVPASL